MSSQRRTGQFVMMFWVCALLCTATHAQNVTKCQKGDVSIGTSFGNESGANLNCLGGSNSLFGGYLDKREDCEAACVKDTRCRSYVWFPDGWCGLDQVALCREYTPDCGYSCVGVVRYTMCGRGACYPHFDCESCVDETTCAAGGGCTWDPSSVSGSPKCANSSAPSAPTPAPAPVTYKCHLDQCVQMTGGVTLEECNSACKGSYECINGQCQQSPTGVSYDDCTKLCS